MITVPEGFTLGFTKLSEVPPMGLGLRTDEDPKRGRVGFINRKQDRFTLSIRFYYSKTTAKGGSYGKWQNLNVLSATLKNGRLNLFGMGHFFSGMRFTKVVNITRKPYLIRRAYPSAPDLWAFFQQELHLLYVRNNVPSPFTDDASNLLNEVVKATYPMWDKLTPTKDVESIEIAPLFATPVLRHSNVKDFVEELTAPQEKELQKFLTENLNLLNAYTLWLLMLGKKRVSEQHKLELLKEFASSGSSSYTPRPGRRSRRKLVTSKTAVETFTSFSAEDLAAARRLLKPLSNEERLSLWTASSSFLELAAALKEWKFNKQLLENRTITVPSSTPTEITWADVKENIESTATEYYKNDLQKSEEEVQRLVSELVASSANTTVYTKRLQVNINDRYECSGFLPAASTSLYASDSYIINFFELSKNANQSTFYKLLKENGLQDKFKPNSTNISLSAYEYSVFLKKLKAHAESLLAKHSIEVTPENVGVYIEALTVLSGSSRITRFKGVVPRKWFRFIREGFSPYVALVFLDKQVPFETALNYLDVPDSWVARAFGIVDRDELADLF